MRKIVTVVLEVESDDEINISDKFIQDDITQELNCASNSYDIIGIRTEAASDNTIIDDLNTARKVLCFPTLITDEMRIRIGQAITNAIHYICGRAVHELTNEKGDR